MKLIHEYDDSGWKQMHRLVAVLADGSRREGSFSLIDQIAILTDSEIQGTTYIATSGYVATTGYYDGVFPCISRYSAAPFINVDEIQTKTVHVLAARFGKEVEDRDIAQALGHSDVAVTLSALDQIDLEIADTDVAKSAPESSADAGSSVDGAGDEDEDEANDDEFSLKA